MSNYRLWYVKRGEKVQGPFPEPMICRFVALGRVGKLDVLSLDKELWHPLSALPELAAGVDQLMQTNSNVKLEDEFWREERAKAALRWLDDRKSPDPRSRESGDTPNPNAERRTGKERRAVAETVEDHHYRENRSIFESWSREQRQRYGWALVFLLLTMIGSLVGALSMNPVNPIKVDFKVRQATCDVAPAKGVNWSGCNMDGRLLIGADLHGAELVGASLRHANLKYADLTQANLTQAVLADADLTGTRFEGAVWTDGRICAAGSIGRCQ